MNEGELRAQHILPGPARRANNYFTLHFSEESELDISPTPSLAGQAAVTGACFHPPTPG